MMNSSRLLSFLRVRHTRRQLMFWLTLVLMGMTFVGGILILDALAKNVVLFTLYWAAVFLQVILVLTLACYDMMAVSREYREQARRNRERIAHPDDVISSSATDREDAAPRDTNP